MSARRRDKPLSAAVLAYAHDPVVRGRTESGQPLPAGGRRAGPVPACQVRARGGCPAGSRTSPRCCRPWGERPVLPHGAHHPVKRPERPLESGPAIWPVTWHPHRDRDLVLADADGRAALVHDMHARCLPGNRTWEPLVGRDAELGFLRDRLAAARAGAGQVVLVCGVTRIGKTRLAEELAASAGDVQVGWGAVLDDAGMPSLWPWIRAVRDLLRRCRLVPAVRVGGSCLHDLSREIWGASYSPPEIGLSAAVEYSACRRCADTPPA